jgi:hypothetical protein
MRISGPAGQAHRRGLQVRQDDPLIVGAIQSALISAFVAKPFSRAEILQAMGHGPQTPGEAPPEI